MVEDFRVVVHRRDKNSLRKGPSISISRTSPTTVTLLIYVMHNNDPVRQPDLDARARLIVRGQ